MPFHKGNNQITSVAEWKKCAPPKSEDQWVADRSAMEVARAWLHDGGNSFPPQVTRILESHPHFGPVLAWHGEPEARLAFDAFAGEPRNTDILVIAQDTFGSYVLAVEAKADEPFSGTVAETLAEALERKIENPRSNGVARVEQLGTALLGPRQKGEPKIGELRYQLLTATAGALREAERQGANRAVLLVHEFVTRKTDDEKHHLNAIDLQRFLSRVSHGGAPTHANGLTGPFSVPGSPLLNTPIRLYIGKVTENLRQ